MRKLCFLIAALAAFVALPRFVAAQSLGGIFPDLTQQQDYISRRVSSYDVTGANADNKLLAGGQTMTVFDEAGPADITHIWITLSSREPLYLKKAGAAHVLGQRNHSQRGSSHRRFLGLGLGEYFPTSRSLWPWDQRSVELLFSHAISKRRKDHRDQRRHSGRLRVYFNIDYRAYKAPCLPTRFIFTRSIANALPARAGPTNGQSNSDPLVDNKTNLTGEGNYVWMEATGRGHYVGVTMSVLQNQDEWWGEGDDMFFIDGEKLPTHQGHRFGRLLFRRMGFWTASRFPI